MDVICVLGYFLILKGNNTSRRCIYGLPTMPSTGLPDNTLFLEVKDWGEVPLRQLLIGNAMSD
jgi:hypothetical protein